MSLKPPLFIPVWQRVVGAIAGVGLIYYLYQGGSGGIAGTIIIICVAFFGRNMFRSGAIASDIAIPDESPLRARSFARDGAVAAGCWVVAILLVIAGAILVKKHAIPDNNLTAGIIVGPSLLLILVGGFFIFRILNGFIFGRRR